MNKEPLLRCGYCGQFNRKPTLEEFNEDKNIHLYEDYCCSQECYYTANPYEG
jgi:hypothetical protein